MKSLTELWRVAAEELAAICHTSATLDFNKLERRVEEEGLSFITITLPSFAKDFERCLEQGKVDPCAFPGFSRKGCLPRFLGGFMGNIFDASTGVLVHEETDLLIDSIFAIRQLCYLYAKIEIPCSDARVSRAIKGYVDCEQEISEKFGKIPQDALKAFRRISSLVFGGVFGHMEWLLSQRHEPLLTGNHGPGATADGLLGNEKFDQFEWPTRLEAVFPYGEHSIPNWRYYYQLDRVEFLEPEAERPVKVITVPKTLKTPRIIAIEPTCMQYMQQALLDPLVEVLERQSLSGTNHKENLACHFMGFSDQNPNRDLARLGSIQGDLATLDLSEASDRVLNELVLTLLHDSPLFSEAVQATRSTRARVPHREGEVILPLVKFASMGSALCFPVEAMVFLVAILYGIEQKLRTPITRRLIKSLQGSVRVYGDDLIVPVDCVSDVIASLELFGLKVNGDKSFWTGKFRESCGGDYYAGHDVTPVKVRREFPSTRHDVQEVISLVALRNLLYQKGLWGTTSFLDKKIGKILPYFPIVEETSPALGRHSLVFDYVEDRSDFDTHSPRVKAFVPRSRPPASRLSGEGALMKSLAKKSDKPFEDPRHLERSGRPLAVRMKLRWMIPF